MERSWDPYYKYFKEFEFNLFEIFIFLEFQQEIIDLGYIGQSQINQNVLNPGQFCVVDGLIKIVHDLPKFLHDEKFKNNLDIEKWKNDSYNLLSLDMKWIKKSSIKIIGLISEKNERNSKTGKRFCFLKLSHSSFD